MLNHHRIIVLLSASLMMGSMTGIGFSTLAAESPSTKPKSAKSPTTPVSPAAPSRPAAPNPAPAPAPAPAPVPTPGSPAPAFPAPDPTSPLEPSVTTGARRSKSQLNDSQRSLMAQMREKYDKNKDGQLDATERKAMTAEDRELLAKALAPAPRRTRARGE